MKTRILFIPALMLALTTPSQAADLTKTDAKLKQKLQTAPAQSINVDQQNIAVEPPTRVKEVEDTGKKLPAVQQTPGLSDSQAERAARAAAANRARQMNEIKDLNGAQDIKNMGDINNLDGMTGGTRPGQGGRLGLPDPNTAPGSGNRSPYQQPEGFSDPMDGHRNSDKGPGVPGGVYAPSPRDAAGGIASQQGGGGGNVTHRTDRHGNLVTYTKVTHHGDGTSTQQNSTYYQDTGEFHSAYDRNVDNQGNTTSSRSLEVVERRTDSETGDTTVVVREERTGSGGGSVHPGRELGGDKGDPPPRDPNNIAGYQPADGAAADGPCDTSLYACQREIELGRQFRNSPDRVNPGDPDNGSQPQGPRLAVDPETLVTNPDPNNPGRGGFVPSEEWAERQREKLEEGAGPGARPPGE